MKILTLEEYLKKVKKCYPDNDKRHDYVYPCGVNVKGTNYDNYKKEDIDSKTDVFDWKGFWSTCKSYFPLHSVCGGSFYSTEEKIKKEEYLRVERVLDDIKRGSTILEIGYGYGGAAKKFSELGCTYSGIDYVSSGHLETEYGKFIEIDKSGIPETLLKQNYDIVYSINVFQHMMKKQRLDYYKQIYDVLTDDGTFCFSLFTKNVKEYNTMIKNNKKLGIKTPIYATHFFGVLTQVPTKREVIKDLKHVGFIVEKTSEEHTADPRTNNTVFIVKKNNNKNI